MNMKQALFLWLAMMAILPAIAQDQTITGKVTDAANGAPLPGVSVSIKGTTRGTITDVSGEYKITAPSNAILLYSFIGYLRQEIAVGGRSSININLQLDDKTLEEVVISGYTTTARNKYTGSVSTVSGKKIEDVPIATFDQMLQGRVPGLYSTSGSGQPGAANRVVIRGSGSISGLTSPLYVVDGVAIETGAFSAMNAADFETITVLKDANAAALYGSRGANGVIVITTKRGKSGRVVFGLKTQHGWSERTRDRFDMMNATQRLQFEEEIGAAGDLGPGWWFSPLNPDNAGATPAELARNKAILDSLRNINTDWRKFFFRDRAQFQEHELNVTGGTDKVKFYTSLNYYKQEGIALRSGLERYSFRTNVDFKDDRFTASVNIGVGYNNVSSIESENTTAVVNPFAAAYYASPYEYPYINGKLVHSGNKAQFGGVYDFREGSDALERVQNTTNKVNQLKGAISLNLRYDLLKNLYARTTLGMDYRESATSRFINPNSYTGSQTTGRQGSYGEGFARYYQFTSTSGLTYHNAINKHEFEVTGLYEFNRVKSTNMNFTGFGINPLFPETPAGITAGSNTNGFIPLVAGSKQGTALASFIGLANYSYDEKYSLNLTFRRDGSTTVPEKNRWNNFWSVGAGWNLKREDFMSGIDEINTLRARVSYGTSASPFPITNPFGYLATYGPTRYEGTPGVFPNSIGNPEYDWEYTNTFNVGFDAAAFDSRIRLTFDWYNKLTSNVFVTEQLSRTTGFTSRNINAGKVRNRGVEVDLSGDIIRNRNLTFYAGFNFGYNKNEVTSLGAVNEFIQGTSILRVGLPIGSHYVVKWAGIDPANGKTQYYDKDGKIAPNYGYNSSTMSVAEFGTFNPPFTGGWHLGLNWKGLNIEALFSFANGFKRFNNEDFFNQNYTFAGSNQSTQWLRRWKKPGDITDIQGFGDPRRFSSRDIQDASYIRFRNLNLSYSLPSSLLERTNLISQVQIYVQAQNIFTITSWSGFDPEDNNNIAAFEYPAARTYTAGVRVNF